LPIGRFPSSFLFDGSPFSRLCRSIIIRFRSSLNR
jgi:hypothetical protein